MSGPRGKAGSNERDLLFMSNPKMWDTWPMLPVVRHHADGSDDCGIMYDCRGGGPRLAGRVATVWICNLFLLPSTLDEFLELPRETFDSFEEVVAAGWRVD